jgi:hypothetical protein
VLHRPWLYGEKRGLLVDTCVTPADGHAERVAALVIIGPRADRRSCWLMAKVPIFAEAFAGRWRIVKINRLRRCLARKTPRRAHLYWPRPRAAEAGDEASRNRFAWPLGKVRPGSVLLRLRRGPRFPRSKASR